MPYHHDIFGPSVNPITGSRYWIFRSSHIHLAPFPSPLPQKRFTALANEDTIRTSVRASFFLEILNEVNYRAFLGGPGPHYLYGPARMGKSHLRMALVFCLIQKRERLVYILNCRILRHRPRDVLRTAILFAFHNDPALCDETKRAKDMDYPLQFVVEQASLSRYIIVDQCNASDLHGTRDLDRDDELHTTRYILQIGYRQRYHFSGCANQPSDCNSEVKQGKNRGYFD